MAGGGGCDARTRSACKIMVSCWHRRNRRVFIWFRDRRLCGIPFIHRSGRFRFLRNTGLVFGVLRCRWWRYRRLLLGRNQVTWRGTRWSGRRRRQRTPLWFGDALRLAFMSALVAGLFLFGSYLPHGIVRLVRWSHGLP